jgi:hypothetical protein
VTCYERIVIAALNLLNLILNLIDIEPVAFYMFLELFRRTLLIKEEK